MNLNKPRGLVAWSLPGLLLLGLGRQTAVAAEGGAAAIAAENSNSLGPELVLQTGHTNRVECLAVSPDGKYLMTGSADFSAILWDIATGRQLRRFTGHMAGVVSVAFSPDAERVLSAAGYPDNSAIVWDAATGKKISVVKAPDSRWVNAAAFSPDGKRLLTCSKDDTAILWDVASGEKLHVLKSGGFTVYCGAFSPDGAQAYTAGNERAVVAWDVARGKQLRTFELASGRMTSIAFSKDCKQVAFEHYPGGIFLWETETGQPPRRVGEGPGGRAMAFTPDGRYLMGGSYYTPSLWDLGTGKAVYQLKSHHPKCSLYAAAFSADGRHMLTGGYGLNDATDGSGQSKWFSQLLLSDTATGTALRAFDGIPDLLAFAAISPDGTLALSGEKSGRIVLWDAATGRALRVLQEKGDSPFVATPVAFSPDGRQALGGSWHESAVLGTEAARHRILFRVGGRLDVVPIDRFFQDFYRPGLLAEIARGGRLLPNVEFAKSVAPLVRIVSPQRSGTVAAARATLQVQLTDRGGGIRGPWLVQNGARVLAPGDSRREGRMLHRTLTLPLVTGENRLEVRAASEDGSWESEPATITLVYEEPQVQPELHVLAVGINRYAQESLNLKYAVPDAQAVAKVFQARGPALYGQGKVHVTALVNEQATKRGIQAALEGAAKKARAQEVPQLGHGVLSYALLAALGAVEAGPLEKQPVKTAETLIGVREWFGYAQGKVPLLTKIYFGQEQLVAFSGQGNNFPVLPMSRN